jgi:hypothetical protein
MLGGLKVHVTVTENPFGLPLDALFSMAARINKKRAFLFVSHVLGKHIPVFPHVPLLAGAALGLLLERELNGSGSQNGLLLEQVVDGLCNPERAKEAWLRLQADKLSAPRPLAVIGFAETATALGHSLFEAFGDGCRYVHTTREQIRELASSINFEEEHSHATSHRCYAEQPVREGEAIVLVDDEMTTGKTTLNIIRDLNVQDPGAEYYVASLLDWRSKADQARFRELEQELGVSIKTLSLLKGEIEVEGSPVLEKPPVTETNSLINSFEQVAVASEEPVVASISLENCFDQAVVTSIDGAGRINTSPYLRCTGRFGISSAESEGIAPRISQAAEKLRALRTGGKALCLGTGEFMHIPMRVAAEMGEDVFCHSTTRSPIHPHDEPSYAVRDAHPFPCPDDPTVPNFVYNVTGQGYDDLFVFLEREVAPERMEAFAETLARLGIPHVYLVIASQPIPAPEPIGSYSQDDVVFLLKNLENAELERPTEDREEAIQGGGHYSEMLPVEYRPTPEYLQLYHATLHESAEKVALAAATVAEQIRMKRGEDLVLVSLARAGTPVGILIRRYLEQIHGLSLPHYSLSIIRGTGRGIDENALLYILQNHSGQQLQFIDGWTGKGAIRRVLAESCATFAEKYGVVLSDELAVLADPGRCAELYGTQEDFLIPSACLNSTVSGLVSRTVLRSDLIGPLDFHGAKFYEEWRDDDLSVAFVDEVSRHFPKVAAQGKQDAARLMGKTAPPTWTGLQDILKIQETFGIEDVNLVKPGVGETTRVLLRRVPWKILVDRTDNPNLQHILMLARDRNVPVEEFPGLTYSCCGLIQPKRGAVE